MRFGPVPLAEAAGAVLAHTQRLPDRMVRKGTVLDDDALAALRAAGIDEVIAARLEPGDVDENAAAARLAAALLAPGLTATRAGTGRVNLLASVPGLFRVDAARLDALNAVDEALTAATLPDAAPVASGSMVATLKVIPFAVPEAALRRVEALAAEGPPALTLHPFRPLVVGLVLTTLPGLKPGVLAGTVEGASSRGAARGVALLVAPGAVPHHLVPASETRRVLDNLVDNAMRYTPRHGTVRLSCRADGRHALLCVADSGPGIPAGMRERVFDRFVRLSNTGTPGSGLGLSIVKNIVAAHGASIALNDGPDGCGLLVEIRFAPGPGAAG